MQGLGRPEGLRQALLSLQRQTSQGCGVVVSDDRFDKGRVVAVFGDPAAAGPDLGVGYTVPCGAAE